MGKSFVCVIWEHLLPLALGFPVFNFTPLLPAVETAEHFSQEILFFNV